MSVFTGLVQIVYEDGVKYSIDKDGIWTIVDDSPNITEDRDGNKCPYCGKTTCCPYSSEYYCVVCKKNIPANTCHPESHLDKSLD